MKDSKKYEPKSDFDAAMQRPMNEPAVRKNQRDALATAMAVWNALCIMAGWRAVR